jgi:hypothetical protein
MTGENERVYRYTEAETGYLTRTKNLIPGADRMRDAGEKK